MNQQATLTARATVTVEASPSRAFDVFTTHFGTWWPPEHHIGNNDPVALVLEPRAGGRWFERDEHGVECDWGRVLEWEPPSRILLAWHLDPTFAYDPDPEHATEVEVRFVAETGGEGSVTRTRVELEHRGFERHGDLGVVLHRSVSGPGGWPDIVARLVAAI